MGDSSSTLRKIKRLYRLLVVIRKTEERIADGVRNRIIRGPCHLSIGQEALAVGLSQNIRKSDRVFGTHRSHAHLLALGADPFRLFSEVLGKSTGFSGGFGGSMHLSEPSIGFFGSVPIVGGTIPLAVGAALAAKKDRTDAIAVCYFGDGATEEGVFHESLNLASMFRVPILFVCENNLFSSHLHISERQPSFKTSRFAKANKIPFSEVDGNSVTKVEKVGRKIIHRMRKTGTPAFLEAFTYRQRGHVGHNRDLDVGLHRRSDLKRWMRKDPLLEFERMLPGSLSQRIKKEVTKEIDEAWEKALRAPNSEAKTLLLPVYSKGEVQWLL